MYILHSPSVNNVWKIKTSGRAFLSSLPQFCHDQVKDLIFQPDKEEVLDIFVQIKNIF